MYAYVLDIGRGFSKVCVDKGNQPHAFRDPRPCCRSRIVLRKHRVGGSRRSESLFIAPMVLYWP